MEHMLEYILLLPLNKHKLEPVAKLIWGVMGNIPKKIKGTVHGIIAPKGVGGREMPYVTCPKCHGVSRTTAIGVNCDPSAKMWGIIRCLVCMHEFPITISEGYIQKLDIALPGIQSDKLNASVSDDIQEDVREAERANFAQCYKASATMCRRAVQLGLIDKGIPDAQLGVMLKQALSQKLLNQDLYNLATSIKGFGDIGAHRREDLEPQEVNMLIYATVRMLNKLFE